MDRAEFALAGRNALDDAESLIRSDVRQALGLFPQPHWMNPIMDAAETVAQESGGLPTGFRMDLMNALTHQKIPSDSSEDFLVRWISTYAVNAGTVASNQDSGDLEWVTMHDDKVRETHREADGQVRAAGKKFKVGTSDMIAPGDPTAPIEEWAGCRCLLRKHEVAMVAAAGGKPKLSVIVGLPEQGSAVHDMGPEPKHMTLLFLGPTDQIEPNALDSIKSEVCQVADSSEPYTDSVSGSAELGADKAQVLLMDGKGAVAHRNALANQPSIMAQAASVEQFPTFIPHVTLGYPGDDTDFDPPSTITFDRLALWHGDEQTEFPLGEAMTASSTQAPPEQIAAATSTPWHGVLVPEGVASGDRRTFAQDSLTNRPLPMPLTWQKFSDERHKGSVTIGSIDTIERVGNEMRGSGRMLNTPEADEVVGQLAHFGRFGVSVDVDSAAFDLDEATQAVTFTAARISSASVVAIPAFAEAYIALGPWPTEGDNPVDTAIVAPPATFAVSDASWDGSSSRFTPEQWRASCVLHKSNSMSKGDHGFPIKEPNGDLNRAAVHNAASRIGQAKGWPPAAIAAAKRSLRGAYGTLGETPPDSLSAAGEVDTLDALHEGFARGAGWITNPEDTRRLHSYWTSPGHPGFEKINWGVPGDFDRCRAEVGKYLVASGEPEFVNQTCALWHHDAIGIWPGQEDGGRKAHAVEGEEMIGVSLVASAPEINWVPRREWFSNPSLKMPTPVTYIEHAEGTRVVGHVAGWSECHIGYPGVCVAPPHSLSNYEHFHLGSVVTDNGIVRVGQITLGGGHADRRLGMRAALAHYDDVTTAVCDVVVGEDEFGIWFSGWVRPSAGEQQRYELLAAKLSGDWRDKAGSMEMIAAHAVNVPGFEVKPSVGVVDGVQVSLVAAGAIEPAMQMIEGELIAFDTAGLASAVVDEMEHRAALREEAKALSSKFSSELAGSLRARFGGQ